MQHGASDAPQIQNLEARERFRTLARARQLNPDDPWVGGYVAYEWTHGRHLFEAYVPRLEGKRVLEFGCNVGASGVVLASLGAKVVGVDIDADLVELARAQTESCGLASCMSVLHVADTRSLPFSDGYFDLIVCNSVLEYVHAAMRSVVQAELVRVLGSGGLLLVLGTSNRLWPREVHSRRWLVNYVPRWIDGFFGGHERRRGVSPFAITRDFPGCRNVDLDDACATYLCAKERMGTSGQKLALMRFASRVLSPLGLSLGMVMPSIAIAFRKERTA